MFHCFICFLFSKSRIFKFYTVNSNFPHIFRSVIVHIQVKLIIAADLTSCSWLHDLLRDQSRSRLKRLYTRTSRIRKHSTVSQLIDLSLCDKYIGQLPYCLWVKGFFYNYAIIHYQGEATVVKIFESLLTTWVLVKFYS